MHRDRPLTAAPEPTEDEAGLLELIRCTLRSDDPTATTALVSSLVAATSEDALAEVGPDDVPVTLEALVDSLAGTPFAETTAALHVIAALVPDELDAARIRRVLADRRHPVPQSVLGVREIAVEQAARMGDELGDGDNVILGLSWPGTRGVTLVAYVDEAFGTRIKDVFLLPEPFDEVCRWYREALGQQGRDRQELVDIAPADARATLAYAITRGDAPDALPTPEDWSGPDGETLGWPAARPFVEMLLRRIPAGGSCLLTSAAYPPVSAEEAARGFLASTQSAAITTDVDVGGAAHLLARDAESGAGHPLRWSPTQVELALSQRLPWAVGATDEALEAVPEVLPAFVRYAHERLGVSASSTADTLGAVEEWVESFQWLRSAAAVAHWREVQPAIEAFEHGDPGPLILQTLAESVGGRDALDRLDAEPLTSERPALDAVPVDVRGTLAEIADAVDGWFDSSPRVEPLGRVAEEWRVATHRLLVWATERNPGWLRRRADARGRAAAALWATGVANRLVGPGGVVLVKDLAADLGVRGALSTKAEALLGAWGVPTWESDGELSDPRLLVSTNRARIIALRDEYRR